MTFSAVSHFLLSLSEPGQLMGVSFSDWPASSLLLVTFITSVCLYLWAFTRWHYWKARGVPYLSPVLPIFGNIYDILLMRSLPVITNRLYNQSKGIPFTGFYAFHTPVLLVRDLDLIHNILTNDFSHFEDRGFHFNVNDFMGRNLVHQNGSDWKFSRSKLVPCFSVTKVRSMLPAFKRKSEILVEKLVESGGKVVNMWETAMQYTTDLIVLLTLGVDPDSMRKDNEDFREAGKHSLGLHFIYHVFVGCFLPSLHKLLRISAAKLRVRRFFKEVVQQVVDYRNNNKCDKKDFLDTLMQMKRDTIKDRQFAEIDDNFIIGQVFMIFFTGFETAGNIMACALYEMAKQPHIQEAVHSEISRVLQKHDGQVTFDSLQDMKYLRQVVSETLRMYAPLSLIFRRCTKDYTIPGTSTVVEKGTLVLIPLRSIFDDPDYYPDPEVFDPDRFSDEASSARHVAMYMPFGVGPRVCPAMLYAQMKMRSALVHILSQLEVVTTADTPATLTADPFCFVYAPKGGIHLSFKKRFV